MKNKCIEIADITNVLNTWINCHNKRFPYNCKMISEESCPFYDICNKYGTNNIIDNIK